MSEEKKSCAIRCPVCGTTMSPELRACPLCNAPRCIGCGEINNNKEL